MAHPLFSISLSLFLLMDPIGNIPVYISLLKEITSKRSMWIIFREMAFALIIIFLFAFFGRGLLSVLDVTQDAVYIAGGVVLFMISVKMIFPEKTSVADSLFREGEPFIFPLAVPLVAGPSVLAAVMIYSKQVETQMTLYLAICIAWVISMLILLSSAYLKKWLGNRGISALERLMGLVLMLIAINMFLDGVDMHYGIKSSKHQSSHHL